MPTLTKQDKINSHILYLWSTTPSSIDSTSLSNSSSPSTDTPLPNVPHLAISCLLYPLPILPHYPLLPYLTPSSTHRSHLVWKHIHSIPPHILSQCLIFLTHNISTFTLHPLSFFIVKYIPFDYLIHSINFQTFHPYNLQPFICSPHYGTHSSNPSSLTSIHAIPLFPLSIPQLAQQFKFSQPLSLSHAFSNSQPSLIHQLSWKLL